MIRLRWGLQRFQSPLLTVDHAFFTFVRSCLFFRWRGVFGRPPSWRGHGGAAWLLWELLEQCTWSLNVQLWFWLWTDDWKAVFFWQGWRLFVWLLISSRVQPGRIACLLQLTSNKDAKEGRVHRPHPWWKQGAIWINQRNSAWPWRESAFSAKCQYDLDLNLLLDFFLCAWLFWKPFGY